MARVAGRSIGLLVLVTVGLGVVALSGCAAPEPPLAFDALDLVVAGEWRVEDPGRGANPPMVPKPNEILCHDESFLALPLEPGTSITTTLTPGENAVLDLAGCSRPIEKAAHASDPAGRLEIEVEAAETAGGQTLRLLVPLTETGGPWRQSLDLGPLAGSPVTLRLRTEGSSGTLYLRTLQVSSFAPRPLRAAPGTTLEGSPRAQILFISLDTLREDAFGGMGGEVATPAFDRFRTEAQVFSPHYASAGWTRPSHGTLLTGLSPRACGAIGTQGEIRPGLRTLAERFQDAGFRTGALFYDIEWLHPRYGFGRGFETYRMERWRLDRARVEAVRWISEHRGEPFFYFLHTFEPHSDGRVLPYESEDTTRETVHERFGIAGYGCRGGLCASSLLVALDKGEIQPLPREPEILRFLYARSAATVDREIGALFDDLRRLGIYDDLLIVLTSDHGEMLLEHGELLHGKPWEEVIRVPLAIKWPGGENAGTRKRLTTGAEDLAPTLLEAAGLEASDLPGTGLRERRRAEPVFVGHNFRAVIDGGLKAVFQGPEVTLLFDLDEDPHEMRNLAEDRPQDVERLHALTETKKQLDLALVRRFERSSSEEQGEVPEMSDEARERLRALGYVGAPGDPE